METINRGVCNAFPIAWRPAAVLNRFDHDEQLIQIRLVGMRMNTSVSSAVRGSLHMRRRAQRSRASAGGSEPSDVPRSLCKRHSWAQLE
jgi:hypothetical protein